jgi:hypothetical protein
MNAYLPSKFLQVTVHKNYPERLESLISLLEEINVEPVVDIDLLDITAAGLLFLPTRQWKFPFENLEINFILDFVSKGNPLFHLSNHGPKLTVQDSVLGQEFGYRFQRTIKGFIPKQKFDVYPMSNPTSVFDPLDQNIHFTICNSSEVIDESGTFSVIADFSRSNVPEGDRNAAFGIARPRSPETGAIVALGDSGLLGEPVPCYPGPGLHAGDNMELVKRILLWLRNQTEQSQTDAHMD